MATAITAVIRTSLSVSVLSSLISGAGWAGELTIETGVDVRAAYTDNVELATESLEQESYVSLISPLIKILGEGRYAGLELNYQGTQANYSHREDPDDKDKFFNELDLSTGLRLGHTGFSLFASSSITLQPQSAANQVNADVISGDVIERRANAGGISYSNGVNKDWLLNITGSVNDVSNEDELGDFLGKSASFNFDSGRGARNLFWNLSGAYNRRDLNDSDSTTQTGTYQAKFGWITGSWVSPYLGYYKEENDTSVATNVALDTENASAGMRFHLSRRSHFDLGYHKSFDDENGNFWGASLLWEPTPRTQMSAGYGKRFYGNAYNFSLQHKIKRWTNSMSYSEEIDSFDRSFFSSEEVGQFYCLNPDATSLADCIVTTGDEVNFSNANLLTINQLVPQQESEVSLDKNYSWDSNLELPRSSVKFRLASQSRRNLVDSDRNRRREATLTLAKKFGRYSSLSLEVDFDKVEFISAGSGLDRLDYYHNYKLRWDGRLTRELDWYLELAKYDKNSTDITQSFDEARVSLGIAKAI